MGEVFRDFSVTDPEGKVVGLGEIKEPGKYTFMDLWASWCGPCRSAIPHVKELKEKYGDRLKVVSVSVDEDDAAWRKAMKEENMSWSQFHAAGDQMNEVASIFFLQSIPRLIVLDPEGRIICSTFSPDVVSDCLSERLASGQFNIRATIPRLKAGTEVNIVPRDVYGRDNLGTTTSEDGSFVLTGSVEQPTMAEIRIEIPEMEIGGYAFPVMLENAEYTVIAENVDSLPPSFYFGHEGLEKEYRIKIEGGQAQREFNEYKAAIKDADIAKQKAHFAAYVDNTLPKDAASRESRAKALATAQVALEKTKADFAAAHPTYSVSGSIFVRNLSTPFAFTAEELDAIQEAVAPMCDKTRLDLVNNALAKARNATKNCAYFDFDAPDSDGNMRKLSELVGKKHVLIDFWASWCGPCRAAIPHVKQLAEKYGDGLTVVSVSVDSDADAWKKAMNQEAMPWLQLHADAAHVKHITDSYQFRSIPFLVVISPEGKIAHSGHDPELLSQFLKANVK